MKMLIAGCLLLALASAGCVSKAQSDARARAAFMAGQKQGMALQARATSVWVQGNVKTQMIPWTTELTLAQALIAAEYQGARDPGEIVIFRKDQPPTHVSAKQLLAGYDLPLEPGDRVEIHP